VLTSAERQRSDRWQLVHLPSGLPRLPCCQLSITSRELLLRSCCLFVLYCLSYSRSFKKMHLYQKIVVYTMLN